MPHFRSLSFNESLPGKGVSYPRRPSYFMLFNLNSDFLSFQIRLIQSEILGLQVYHHSAIVLFFVVVKSVEAVP
uniref:Uncharacterized protein n=1 Tax=Utricularia reniformis TaxID=192314 RepID=A0A1Y0B3G4_9LAMI|nr:hypothetical protein AEK19_MT1746 [Utricularia reniformis]ART31923.1 hypothetical protein AEK19_MT1746 [Utricularia reniformis]